MVSFYRLDNSGLATILSVCICELTLISRALGLVVLRVMVVETDWFCMPCVLMLSLLLGRCEMAMTCAARMLVVGVDYVMLGMVSRIAASIVVSSACTSLFLVDSNWYSRRYRRTRGTLGLLPLPVKATITMNKIDSRGFGADAD